MIARPFSLVFTLVVAVIGGGQPTLAQTSPAYPAPASQPMPPPAVTQGLLPGHWQLIGAHYVWVPPDTALRPVEPRPFVAGALFWTGDRWVYVPEHFAASSED